MEFVAKPGQIDYTHVRYAPTINCVVKFQEKILLVQRSDEMHLYPGLWNGISGYLDDDKNMEDKAKEELQEEAGISEEAIQLIRPGRPFNLDAPEYKKTWIVHPVLVEVDSDKIILNGESIAFQWVAPSEAHAFNLVPGFNRVIEEALKTS